MADRVASHKTADKGQAAVRVEEVEAAAIRPIAKATIAAAQGVGLHWDQCQSQVNNINSRTAVGHIAQDSRQGAKQQ